MSIHAVGRYVVRSRHMMQYQDRRGSCREAALGAALHAVLIVTKHNVLGPAAAFERQHGLHALHDCEQPLHVIWEPADGVPLEQHGGILQGGLRLL